MDGLRILYLMHVDWNWIKQRPHYMAESLDRHKTTVLYIPSYQKGKLVTNHPRTAHLTLCRYFKLPFARFGWIKSANDWIIRFTTALWIRKYDVIYLCHPLFMSRSILKCGKVVVYDCMDDVLSFPKMTLEEKRVLHEKEKSLVERAECVLCSSDDLKRKLISRYKVESKYHVVNNATSIDMYEEDTSLPFEIPRPPRGGKLATYIGTISEWMDFNLLEEMLKRNEKLIIMLVGPIQVKAPRHERLILPGPVDQRHIKHIMRISDALVMPFEINDLIRSVNPVKLYEYIYSEKPVICVKYKETEIFRDYVHLYEYGDLKQCNALFERLLRGKLKPLGKKASREEFLKNNTWKNRGNVAMKIIESHCKRLDE